MKKQTLQRNNLEKKETNSKNKYLKKYILWFLFIVLIQHITWFGSLYIIEKNKNGFFKTIIRIKEDGNEETNNYWVKILNLNINGSSGFPSWEFSKYFIYIYIISCWWWFLIAPYLIYKYLDKKIIFQLFISYFIILAISLILFFVFPVQMLDKFLFKENKSFVDFLIQNLYKYDCLHFNYLPSFHVSLSFLCYIGFRQKNKKKIPKILNYGQLFCAILVFISTFVLKQHYIMDGIIAIILVETTFFLVGKKMNNIKKDYQLR
ncbi:hypothetical protein HPP_2690 [Hydrangea phyllody phytoplasma]|uniref:Phosphatase PAP2 family protein n=2 Tax=16SrI (Aster yellows group) TaxID=3042590 RepID=A0ABQ5PS38_9MOLU|nr:phosphatase PAP2 family protein [Hydrangea phyllody phytoplasma]GFZ75311.1 hypothetical protein HPP_2690 [Hydrangea phyllody phytoplasma]GLH61134.1 hypothetical protein RHYP_0790 [Rhus yellows phytoplasma]GLH62117.1 hypothetical protein HP2P_5240 [Hydrangea phyllody phytoplasma]